MLSVGNGYLVQALCEEQGMQDTLVDIDLVMYTSMKSTYVHLSTVVFPGHGLITR